MKTSGKYCVGDEVSDLVTTLFQLLRFSTENAHPLDLQGEGFVCVHRGGIWFVVNSHVPEPPAISPLTGDNGRSLPGSTGLQC